jgi:hypothetical protein
MWRFQIPAQFIPKYAQSFIEFPPMQAGASFNVGDIREKIKQAQELPPSIKIKPETEK